LSFELRPAVLDELGIESAIGALVDLAEQHGISVELRVDLASQRGRKPARYTVELDTAIYRVIHEALDNVHDHAAATHATVSVTETDGTIELSIHDNGGGFDPAGVTEGYGLAGLRDRIELLQGELLIDTAPGHGTTLRASLPVRHCETPDLA